MFYRRRVVLVNDGLSTKEFGVIAQVVARLLFFQRLRAFISYLDTTACAAMPFLQHAVDLWAPKNTSNVLSPA